MSGSWVFSDPVTIMENNIAIYAELLILRRFVVTVHLIKLTIGIITFEIVIK